MAMDNFDESFFNDGWSSSFQDYLETDLDLAPPMNFDIDRYMNESPLPAPVPQHSHSYVPPPRIQPRHNYSGHNISTVPPPSFQVRPPGTLNHKSSNFDLPNFPLQSDPVGTPSNTSGRPLISSNQSPRRTLTAIQELPYTKPTTPSSENSFWSSPESSDISTRSETPFTQTEDLSVFVDLTQGDSPLLDMPRTIQTRRRGAGSPSTRDKSSAPSNPAKRRKIEAPQASIRSTKIEEIDLRDVDNDSGLSKVLEQQRVATIKAQQEQANKPIKLSTLQCIICMENMKDLTATHCGKP